MPLIQGQILNNRYRIVKLLGRGGMGDVYKAWDLSLSRPCALKESLEFSPEGQHQFMREAQILAGLHHPNLPRVTDYFNIPGQGQYLVMDFVEGKDLEELRQQAGGRLPEAQVLDWMMQVLDALNYMHRQRQPVIHRDIKPANIKIAPPDEAYPQGRAMLVDFGIAKIYDPNKDTTVGARAISVGYSPYEQYGQTTVATDERSDIYALGATLYTLLTGKEPVESILRMVHDPLVPPSQLNPSISSAVQHAILQAMHMDPDKRFQRAKEFKAAISGQLLADHGQPTLITQQPSPISEEWKGTVDAIVNHQRDSRTSLEKRLGIGVGVLAGLMLLGVLVGLAYKEIKDSQLTQASQARASQTVVALAALSTSTIPPLHSSITPSSTPIPLTHTSTRSPRPPSRTPTRTPRPTPSFTAAEDMHCRAGPATYYEDYTMVLDGQIVPLLALWVDNDWKLVGIDNLDTRTKCCWVGGVGSLNVDIDTIRRIDFLPDRIECDLTP